MVSPSNLPVSPYSMAKKILIVEDDPAARAVLKDELEFLGFETEDAEDGAIGLQKAKKDRPDLILLDIVLPKMNGMTVLEKLRADIWGRSVPVILLTRLEPDDKIMAGIHRFEPSLYLMKKDWTLKEAAEKVHDIVSSRSAATSPA